MLGMAASFEGSLNVGVWGEGHPGQRRQVPLEGDSSSFFSGFIFRWCDDLLEVPTPPVLETMDCSLWDPCLQPVPGCHLVPWTSSWPWPWHINIYISQTLHVTMAPYRHQPLSIALHQGALALKQIPREEQAGLCSVLFGEHCRACRFMKPCDLMWQMLWRCTNF